MLQQEEQFAVGPEKIHGRQASDGDVDIADLPKL